MAVTKIDDAALHSQNKFHSCLDDVPGLSAREMKEFMDFVPRNVLIPKVNLIIDELENKPDAQNVYTKDASDALLSHKADSESVYDKTQTDALLSGKTDKASVYTKEQTDGKYANMLCGKARGESVEIDDFNPTCHGLSLRLESVNLIPAPVSKQETVNGINIVYSEDGSYTLSGRATESADLRLLLCDGNPTHVEAGKYYLCGCPEGGSRTTCWFAVHNAVSGYDIYFAEEGGGILLDLKTPQNLYFTIRVAKGTMVENAVFRPMLVRGEEPKEFAPHVSDFSGMKVFADTGTNTNAELYADAEGNLENINPDGSICLTAAQKGTEIYAEYNRDINKAFKKITHEILLLKGE